MALAAQNFQLFSSAQEQDKTLTALRSEQVMRQGIHGCGPCVFSAGVAVRARLGQKGGRRAGGCRRMGQQRRRPTGKPSRRAEMHDPGPNSLEP
jgi:hypothetical protein